MWRTIAVVLGAAVLVVASAVAGSALASAAGGGTVYIATGENFPDAVTAGAAGGAGDGPVLLVRQNSIPAATLGELNRLQPGTIVIVGGTAVISLVVEDQLKALVFGPLVVRNGGADRYETAALLSEDTFPKIGAASCPGVGFYPGASGIFYDGFSSRRFDGVGSTSFHCEVSLPHGATVTRLSAGIDDTDLGVGSTCRLRRINIVGGGLTDEIGLDEIMAQTPSTVGMVGKQALTTTTVSDPLVNNFRYGYYIACSTGEDRRILGATVHYELTG